MSAEDFDWFDEAQIGPFYALSESSIGGHSWAESATIWDLGEFNHRKLRYMGLSLAQRGEATTVVHPYAPHWPHPALADVPGPWLIARPIEGEYMDESGHWHGALVNLEPVLKPNRAQADIHRRFARLNSTTAIRQFADKYGFLGSGYTCVVRLVPQQVPYGEMDRTGWYRAEHRGHWQHEIGQLRFLLQLWDWVLDGRVEQLRRYIHWNDLPRRVQLIHVERIDGRVTPYAEDRDYDFEEEQPYWMTLARSGTPDGDTYLSMWGDGEVLVPTRHAITWLINAKLRKRVHAQLRADGMGIYFQPESLLANLYVSFAREILGQGQQRRICARPSCGRYFIPEHGRQKYCDDDCRKRAWEERRRGLNEATPV